MAHANDLAATEYLRACLSHLLEVTVQASIAAEAVQRCPDRLPIVVDMIGQAQKSLARAQETIVAYSGYRWECDGAA